MPQAVLTALHSSCRPLKNASPGQSGIVIDSEYTYGVAERRCWPESRLPVRIKDLLLVVPDSEATGAGYSAAGAPSQALGREEGHFRTVLLRHLCYDVCDPESVVLAFTQHGLDQNYCTAQQSQAAASSAALASV